MTIFRKPDKERRITAYHKVIAVSCPRKFQDLDEESILENPVKRRQKPHICHLWSAAKDPWNCPTLLFHEDKKVKYMALLLRGPVVVWPLREEAVCSTLQEFQNWVSWKQPHTSRNKAFKGIVKTMLGKMLLTAFEYLNKMHKELQTDNQTITESMIRASMARWGPDNLHKIFFFFFCCRVCQ